MVEYMGIVVATKPYGSACAHFGAYFWNYVTIRDTFRIRFFSN